MVVGGAPKILFGSKHVLNKIIERVKKNNIIYLLNIRGDAIVEGFLYVFQNYVWVPIISAIIGGLLSIYVVEIWKNYK